MPVKIKVWSDFVCPFCMIAEKPLHDAIQESGLEVEIEWMPFELRPYPTPTLRPEDSYLQTIWPQSVYPLAESYDIPIKLPSISPQPHSGLAWEGYQYARHHGKGTAYNDRILKAFFQEDKDIGDIEVLAQLAEEIGLDKSDYRRALEEHVFQEQHLQALQEARRLHITAVPTMLIGHHRLSGVQQKDALLHALRAEAAKDS